MAAQTKSITTNKGEALTLTKLGKSRISFGWYRRIERVIYEADDGSYWARYDNRWKELASYVSTALLQQDSAVCLLSEDGTDEDDLLQDRLRRQGEHHRAP